MAVSPTPPSPRLTVLPSLTVAAVLLRTGMIIAVIDLVVDSWFIGQSFIAHLIREATGPDRPVGDMATIVVLLVPRFLVYAGFIAVTVSWLRSARLGEIAAVKRLMALCIGYAAVGWLCLPITVAVRETNQGGPEETIAWMDVIGGHGRRIGRHRCRRRYRLGADCADLGPARDPSARGYPGALVNHV